MTYPLTFAEYSEALNGNRLLGLKCEACGAVACPPRASCLDCQHTKLSQVELSGGGIIKSFTTTYVAPMGRESEAPYIIVLVALDEGPWIAGNLGDYAPEKAGMDLIGKRVTFGHALFEGDLYSAGPAAKPVFNVVP